VARPDCRHAASPATNVRASRQRNEARRQPGAATVVCGAYEDGILRERGLSKRSGAEERTVRRMGRAAAGTRRTAHNTGGAM
jgi:hypothetical protein